MHFRGLVEDFGNGKFHARRNSRNPTSFLISGIGVALELRMCCLRINKLRFVLQNAES